LFWKIKDEKGMIYGKAYFSIIYAFDESNERNNEV